MKILFLSVKVGMGHNIMANNVAQKFKENGHEVLVHEIFTKDRFSTFIVSDVGFKLMFKLPHTANHFYRKAKKSDKHIYFWLNKRIKKQTLDVINSFQPDVIISTHIAGYIFVKTYSNEINKPVLNYFVSTDFEITPGLSNFKDNEYIIVPTKDFVEPLTKKGFPQSNVLPFGIPIKKNFTYEISKQEAMQQLNIDLSPDKLTILVMGKKNGMGKTYKIIKQLASHSDLQIISSSGSNEKLKSKIDKIAQNSAAKIYTYKYNSEYIMTLADIMIGKTGGLSSAEALSKCVPIIALEYAPMPEYLNLMYLSEKNAAFRLKKLKQLYPTLKQLDIKQMQNNCRELQNLNTLDLIYDHVISTLQKSQN